MTTFSPRLDLPFLEGAQAQKHVTHNEALERLDIAVQASVQLWQATTPPTSPAEGQCFLVGAAPSGAWAGHAGDIAAFAGGGWLFVTPQPGWRIWDAQNEVLRIRRTQGWTSAGGAPELQNLDGIGVNATSDATNRLAVASDATLLTHAGAGHQLKINKSDSADTASLLFQSDFAGHAEMGLAGTNDFTIKVSDDGSAFSTAMAIDAATGTVHLPGAVRLGADSPANQLDVYEKGTWTPVLGSIRGGDYAGVTKLNVVSADYVRIGHKVDCWVTFSVPDAPSKPFTQKSSLSFTGLPFAPKSNAEKNLHQGGVTGMVYQSISDTIDTLLQGSVGTYSGVPYVFFFVFYTGVKEANATNRSYLHISYFTDD